jgi:hypothetical protein
MAYDWIAVDFEAVCTDLPKRGFESGIKAGI